MGSGKGQAVLLNLFQQLLAQQEEQASSFQKPPITTKTNHFHSSSWCVLQNPGKAIESLVSVNSDYYKAVTLYPTALGIPLSLTQPGKLPAINSLATVSGSL